MDVVVVQNLHRSVKLVLIHALGVDAELDTRGRSKGQISQIGGQSCYGNCVHDNPCRRQERLAGETEDTGNKKNESGFIAIAQGSK